MYELKSSYSNQRTVASIHIMSYSSPSDSHGFSANLKKTSKIVFPLHMIWVYNLNTVCMVTATGLQLKHSLCGNNHMFYHLKFAEIHKPLPVRIPAVSK